MKCVSYVFVIVDIKERKEDLDQRKRKIDECNTKKYTLVKQRDEHTNKRK